MKITDPNKFLQILLKMNVLIVTDSLDYVFEIHELEPHKYHVIASHSILRRLDFIQSEVYI